MHPAKGLRLAYESLAHHLPTETIRTPTGTAPVPTALPPPDLAAVVEAWPELPEALKAGIVAMVKAARS